MATPSECMALSSICPEYRMSSPVVRWICPALFHLTSDIPRIFIPYVFISFAMVCDFQDIFIERTFQHATFVTDFVLKGFCPVTSFRLWPPEIILPFVEGPLLPKSTFLSVSFSVSLIQSYPLSGGLAYPKVPGIFLKATGQSLPLSGHWPVEFLPLLLYALCRCSLLLSSAGVVESPLFIHSWIGLESEFSFS